ncbi:pentapeptide repeat-containing protein [Actinokineospora soli]|uniref:Pentapeptide repeat-containing protein n=1 Tax=Actinokineospora soli TaxID=1048753 RepID=A0ABW2TPC9_9PSEU
MRQTLTAATLVEAQLRDANLSGADRRPEGADLTDAITVGTRGLPGK